MSKSKQKKKLIKKSPKKRTYKQAFDKSKKEESPKIIEKHKNKGNSKIKNILRLLDLEEDNNNQFFKKDDNIKREISNQRDNIIDKEDNDLKLVFNKANINSFCTIYNEEFYINKENLNKVIYYEQILFNEINVIGDGNCLFRCISYHLFGTQNNYEEIRLSVYNYIKNNPTFVYEYCYEENNLFYIDVETKVRNKTKKIKYFIEDYIECIQKDGFFSGFIELYTLLKIYDIPTIILIENSNRSLKTYKKIMDYNNSDNYDNKFLDIIYLLFVNNDHYIYLEHNKRYIKNINRNNNTLNKFGDNLDNEKNIEIRNKNDNKIERNIIGNKFLKINEYKNKNTNNEKNKNFEKKINIITNNNNEELIENKNNKNNLDDFSNSSKISSKDASSNNNDITDINLINNSNENGIKEIENPNKNEEKISFKNDSNYDKNVYELYINFFKKYKNYIKRNDEILLEIPNFPILIGDKIKPFYYANYFIYLYCDKNMLLDVTRYPDYINKIKSSKIKRDKKKHFRKLAKQFFLDDNNKL